MKKPLLILALFLGIYSAKSQNIDTFFNQADEFFKVNVTNGKVAYDAIYKNPSTLNELLKIAESISVEKNNPNTYQAFWINAYNLLVIKGLVDKYPTKSPLDHSGFFDKNKYNIAGKKVTLNEIENNLLRGNFKEPRFHFVLVCGAVGCPPLIDQAYLPETLDSQMETQTKIAINGNFIRVNNKKKRVEVSQIMEWYKEDFITKNSNEIDFLNKYLNEKLESNYKLNYFPYDWTINKQ